MKVALVGNPNAGKTSVFNLLTGLNQKVGNYPGVTVDKKWGHFSHEGTDVELLDLPGFIVSIRSLKTKRWFSKYSLKWIIQITLT